MNEINLPARLRTFSYVNGSFQAAVHVPIYLSVGISLIKNAGTGPLAAQSLVVFWVFSFSRFFSLFFEVFGGWASDRLGSLGSFIILPYSLALRGCALFLFGFSQIPKSEFWILFFATVGAFLGELGRAFLSGSFEDAYEQTAKTLLKNNKNYISNLDVLKRNCILISKSFFSFVMIIGIFLGTKYNVIFSSLPFFFAGLIHFIAIPSIVKWKDWAFVNLLFDKKPTEKKSQMKIFFKKFDFIWCLGFGGFYFLYVHIINMGPLLGEGTLESLINSSLSFDHLFVPLSFAVLLPFISSLPNLLLKNKGQWFSYIDNNYRILLFLIPWSVMIFYITLARFSGIEKVLAAALVCITFDPFRIWAEWLRNPTVEGHKANPLLEQYFGQNSSFYYSLISGSVEVSLAIFGTIMSMALKNHLTIFFIIIIANILFLSRYYKIGQFFTKKQESR